MCEVGCDIGSEEENEAGGKMLVIKMLSHLKIEEISLKFKSLFTRLVLEILWGSLLHGCEL